MGLITVRGVSRTETAVRPPIKSSVPAGTIRRRGLRPAACARAFELSNRRIEDARAGLRRRWLRSIADDRAGQGEGA